MRFIVFLSIVYYITFFFRSFLDSEDPKQQEEVPELIKAHRRLDELWYKHETFRRLARLLMGNPARHLRMEQKALPVEDQFQIVSGLVKNAIETWGWIQAATGVRVHYVLQPAIGWTRKPLTEIENECFQEDLRTIESVKRFTDRAIYLRFRSLVGSACSSASVRFHDANEWLEAPEFCNENVFTDSCHFNDRGNELFAGLLRERLEWK